MSTCGEDGENPIPLMPAYTKCLAKKPVRIYVPVCRPVVPSPEGGGMDGECV